MSMPTATTIPMITMLTSRKPSCRRKMPSPCNVNYIHNFSNWRPG